MYIFKNALLSIKRNKGRNILIGIIILVIACASSIALAIHNTATNLIKSYEDSITKEATITFNRKGMMENFDLKDKETMEEAKEKFDEIDAITIENVKEYGNSDYLEDYYYTYQINLNGNNIEKVSSDFSFGEKNDRPGKEDMPDEASDFTVVGYDSVNSMTDFINGNYQMTQITEDAWDKIFTGNYVFINSELAELNDISLNDEIILESNEGDTYSFIVLGIYESNEDDAEQMDMFSKSSNTILTSADYLVETFSDQEDIHANVNPTFILKSFDDTLKFQDELYEKGLNENYVISTNEDTALESVNSISNVSSFATTFLIITLIIGAVVLFVINMINIRERKYEIGVLRTIGLSKLKLTMQFVFELFVVSFLAILIGTGIGASCSKPISNQLLASEIASSQEEQNKIDNNMMGGPHDMKENNNRPNTRGIVNIQAYDSINAVVGFKELGELIGIGVILVFVSSLASLISIERFSPLTILKERS